MNKKPENSTIINVCVIPSDEAGKSCVELSQDLESKGTMFVLDGKSKFAHMTVFMARFADNEIPNVIGSVGQALKTTKIFLCEHTGYFMTAGRYLEASYRRSESFMVLHELLVSALSSLRINPGDPFEEDYFMPYTTEQRKNAEETGYDLAHSLYRPHVTLARYSEGSVPNIFPGFKPVNLSFRLSKICVYKADDNGAVYEKLAEFFVD